MTCLLDHRIDPRALVDMHGNIFVERAIEEAINLAGEEFLDDEARKQYMEEFQDELEL